MKVWYRAGIKLGTPGSAARHVSAVRHVTKLKGNCAMEPSTLYLGILKEIGGKTHIFQLGMGPIIRWICDTCLRN